MKKKKGRRAARTQKESPARGVQKRQKKPDADPDATGRRRAEEELRNSREVLELIFKISPDPSVITRRSDGMIVGVNERFISLSGYSRKELIGKTSVNLNLYETIDSRRKILEELDKNGYCQNFETVFRNKNGDRITGTMSSQIVLLAGAPHVFSIIRDITDLKKAEEALRQSNENLSRIIKTTPDAICITRVADGMFVEVNQAFTDITGYAPEELLGFSSLPGGVALWTKAEDRERMVTELKARGEVVNLEMSLRIKNGTIRTSLLSARVLEIAGEKCILTVARDITERKRMEDALKRSEALFSSAFMMSPAATILSRLQDGMCIDANEAYAKLVGFSRDELVGKTTNELNIWMSSDERNRMVSGLAQAGRLQNVPITLRKKDGSLISTIAFGEIVTIEGKQCILSFFYDITEREQAEEKLKKTVERLDLATSAAHEGIWDWDIQRNELVWDDRMYELYGIKREDFAGAYEAWLAGVHPDDRNASNEASRQAQRGEREYDTEFRVVWPDGTVRHLRAYGMVVRDATGKPLRMIGTNFDITERKQAEEALKESEERFSRLAQASFEGVAIHDKGLILDANQAMADLFGYELSEFIGMNVLDLAMPESRDLVRNNFLAGYEKPYEAMGRKKDGTVLVGELRSREITYKGRMVRVTAIRDITERKQAEETLHQSEQKYRDLANSLTLVIFEMDPTGLLTYANSTAFDWFGYSEADLSKGVNVLQLIVEDDRKSAVENMRRVIGLGETTSSEYSVKRKDGSIFPVLAASRPIVKNGKTVGIRGTLLDLTERKNFESVMNNAQKLDSLGVLAGGIAHDFNNLLTGIFGYIDLARSVSKDAKVAEYLESTIATMNRARALTMQLLTFAKGGSPVQKITPLAPFIQEAVQFALSGSNVSCRFSFDKNLWSCNIDKNQIGQVIDNIVINAQQAMPSGGTIEISATNSSLGEKDHPPLAKGDYVKVSIKDSGIGIPKEIMPRIFDPFYTTKTKGHGLGLATCYSIINRHGGCIDVESEQGKGSTFHVYLPASTEAAVADTAAAAAHTGSGTIIVMDDEELIQGTLQKMLESMGYAVVCKKDGREAVDFYVSETRAKKQFSAMIFDLTIPGGMGGVEAVAEIRTLNRELPVFVVSGYADNSVMRNPVDYGFTASISKPFTIAELSEMLEKSLKKRNPDA
jgi:PAS domain S-box-containing protein